MKFAGYRNTIIALCALGLMAEIAWIAGPDHVADLGSTFSGIGLAVGAIIGGRALNKMATRGENGNAGK